ncbi:hypothetical protein AX16_004781 [Volvariella volvacea WC 439]|nr:hypothetical protein AX16_004781 [Volvariella volvacea WC 439]
MLDLVMRDLAAVHRLQIETLWDEFEDYYAWDFYRDEFQLADSPALTLRSILSILT